MSKPNLPPLPDLPEKEITDVICNDDGDEWPLREWLEEDLLAWATAYAEEAVRQALAAQVPALTDAMILHRWDTHVGELSAGTAIEDSDKIAFARAVLMESASGHKPAAVDTSSGHSAAVAGEAICKTCGGSRVDPGGLPICRDCGPLAVEAQLPWHLPVQHWTDEEKAKLLAAPQATDQET